MGVVCDTKPVLLLGLKRLQQYVIHSFTAFARMGRLGDKQLAVVLQNLKSDHVSCYVTYDARALYNRT